MSSVIGLLVMVCSVVVVQSIFIGINAVGKPVDAVVRYSPGIAGYAAEISCRGAGA